MSSQKILNSTPQRFQLTIVKLNTLKAGDLFFTPGYRLFVKFSEHEVKHLSTDGCNVMPITGKLFGHKCTMNTETPVYVYKNSEDWFTEVNVDD